MAAGIVAAHAGVTVKFDGAPSTLTDEPMSQISGKYYRVTDATKRCFDPRVALVVQDDAVDVDAADIEYIDYLHGIVKFASGYTVTAPVTISEGSYLPFSALGVVKSFDFKLSRELLDKSVFGNAFRRYLGGLGDFTLDLGAFDYFETSVGVGTLEAAFAAGTTRVFSLEIIQDGTTLANGGLVIRGLVKPQSPSTSADPAAIVENATKFEGCPMMSEAAVSGPWPVTWSVLDGATGLYV